MRHYMFDCADVEVSHTPLQPIPASPSEISGLFSAGAPLGSAGFSDVPAFFSPSNCVGGILSPISSACMRHVRLGDSMMSQNKTRLLFQSPPLSSKKQQEGMVMAPPSPCKAVLVFNSARTTAVTTEAVSKVTPALSPLGTSLYLMSHACCSCDVRGVEPTGTHHILGLQCVQHCMILELELWSFG